MKQKLKVVAGFLCLLALVGILLSKTGGHEQAAMAFPEPLAKEGCLALNYHRVRQDRLGTKVLEAISGSQELAYYSIYDGAFQDQMQWLKDNGAYFATPEELQIFRQEDQFPPKCVWISFDDIDESVYENAFPILKELQIPFTLFLIAGHVGSDNYSNLVMANWDQLQAMVDSGLASIGSHTWDLHRLEGDEPLFFKEGQAEAFRQDLRRSKEAIEGQLKGVEVLDFAYPFGNGAPNLAEILREEGFRSASILAPRVIDGANDPFWQNRILVDVPVFESQVMPWVRSQ